MLEVRGLKKSYGATEVLRGVDLSVPEGRVLGLLGANGAGKTTLISIAAGLRRPDAGTVTIAGIDVLRHRRRAATLLGLAPQELGVYPTLTVAENLHFAARLAGVAGRDVRQRVAQVAESLGLAPQLRQRADALSGGQRRRLHTAMALLHRPRMLFLDEPTVGADVTSRAGILDIVRAMAAQGTTIVYTTHYLTELEALGAHIAVLDQGRIVADAPLADILANSSARVTLRFGYPPPPLLGWRVSGANLVATLDGTDPGSTVVRALADLGAAAADLAGVEISQPSLESAYLTITGQQYTVEEEDALVA